MKSSTYALLTLAAILLFVPNIFAGSISVSFFPASVYSSNTTAMNTAVGVSGDLIDSFDSTSFLPGLSITLSGPEIGGTPITETSLPALFNGTTFSSFTANQAWDSTDSFTVGNAANNLPNSTTNPSNISKLITFNYAPGTTQFGIGLSNFQSPNSSFAPITNHDLIVNGTDLGTLESLAGSNWTPGIVRNAYLVINDSGGLITSVGFQNDTAPDFLMFGDLAVAPASTSAVPEPSSLLLFGSGLLGLGPLIRRRLVRS
jgi:hypothetical protein